MAFGLPTRYLAMQNIDSNLAGVFSAGIFMTLPMKVRSLFASINLIF